VVNTTEDLERELKMGRELEEETWGGNSPVYQDLEPV